MLQLGVERKENPRTLNSLGQTVGEKSPTRGRLSED